MPLKSERGGIALAGQESYSYDQVPYRSLPFAQSHPDRLAVIATLFGMQPQPIDRCRVLELGCASGGNLIPMAEMFPECLFLGVDLSERQLAEGWNIVRHLGLENVRLLRCDIRDFGPEMGTFHYIIAHGVYSWVPSEVRRKILQICRDQLEPNGVAYISYNTYPGWRMRGMIRDMLVYHSHRFSEPQQRIDQSRELLKFLAESADKNSAYGVYLKEELNLFSQASDSYLYHDHLEDENEPIYFHEFVSQAEHFGLQFLGEADFHMMAYWNFAPEVSQTLERLSGDLIQIEQYMDFLRNRTFRQTLLCHGGHKLDRSLVPNRVNDLYFASPLKPELDQIEVHDPEPLRFTFSSLKITITDALIKSALLCLSETWPRWLHFPVLLDQARKRCDADPRNRQHDALRLAEHLIRCYASNGVEVHTGMPRFITRTGERPEVSLLARLQAESGATVTNRKHEYITLDTLSRHLVQCLDGDHDRTAVLDRLQWLVMQKQLTVNENDEAVEEPQRVREILGEILPKILDQLAQTAMLIR